MIMEKLRLDDAIKLCAALYLSEGIAYQYHHYEPNIVRSPTGQVITDVFGIIIIVKPSLAKAIFQNSSFQSIAQDIEKVRLATLSQDLDLVKNTLKKYKGCWYYPLQMACKYGQLDVLELLFDEYGFEISIYRKDALKAACTYGHLDIVQFLFSHLEPNFGYYDNCIVWASSEGHAGIFRFLLSYPRVDPSYQRNDAIINAERGHVDILHILLQDHRVDPSDQDNQALRCAIKKRNVEIVKLLLESIHRAQLESCEKGNLFEILLQMDVCNCNTSVLKY